MADHGNLSRDHYIDGRLREYRPDRYQPGDEFFDRVIESIPDELYDLEQMLRSAKRTDVMRRETKARRNANKLLRDFHSTGQLELHWQTTANEPLSITTYDVDDDGNEVKVREYVTLRAATVEDFTAWAANEESAAQEDFEARMAAVEGARQIAADMTTRKCHQFISWAEIVAPTGEEGAA